MKELVSIIVPCYNQAEYLDECLQSVSEQSYQNWECIIVNDGSPDDTEEISQKWCERDQRFKYSVQQNIGVSAARNNGIKLASGSFILPLDADDKIGSSYISNSVKEFKKRPYLKLVYCKAKRFGEDDSIWELPYFSLKNLAFNNVIFCSALYRKSDWENIGGYDENMIVGLEDWDFWISLLKNGGQVNCLNEFSFFYRVKSKSRQASLSFQDKKKIFDYLSVKHADFFVKQMGSFQELELKIRKTEKESYKNVKSKRKALNVFLRIFFGVKLFSE